MCVRTFAIAVNASNARVCTNQEGEDMRILKYLATFELFCGGVDIRDTSRDKHHLFRVCEEMRS